MLRGKSAPIPGALNEISLGLRRELQLASDKGAVCVPVARQLSAEKSPDRQRLLGGNLMTRRYYSLRCFVVFVVVDCERCFTFGVPPAGSVPFAVVPLSPT